MPGWHRADIIAALHKRGCTLTGLGKANGKAASSLAAALIKPSRGCNVIIAKALNAELHELWPAWFDKRGRLRVVKANRRTVRESTQNRGRKLSVGEAA